MTRLLMIAMLACGCADTLTIRADIEDGQVPLVVIYEGRCNNRGAVVEDAQRLPPGSYAVVVKAIDDCCRVVKSGCADLSAPSSEDVVVDLVAVEPGPCLCGGEGEGEGVWEGEGEGEGEGESCDNAQLTYNGVPIADNSILNPAIIRELTVEGCSCTAVVDQIGEDFVGIRYCGRSSFFDLAYGAAIYVFSDNGDGDDNAIGPGSYFIGATASPYLSCIVDPDFLEVSAATALGPVAINASCGTGVVIGGPVTATRTVDVVLNEIPSQLNSLVRYGPITTTMPANCTIDDVDNINITTEATVRCTSPNGGSCIRPMPIVVYPEFGELVGARAAPGDFENNQLLFESWGIVGNGPTECVPLVEGEAPWLIGPTLPRVRYVWASVISSNISTVTSACGVAFPRELPLVFGDIVRININAVPNVAVVFGNIVISQDLDSIFFLRDLRFVTGNVELRNQADALSIDLSELEVIGGRFDVRSNPGLLDFDADGDLALRYIGGNLALTANDGLESIDMPLLATVGGTVTINNNPNFPCNNVLNIACPLRPLVDEFLGNCSLDDCDSQ